jgi:hypothetical protein
MEIKFINVTRNGNEEISSYFFFEFFTVKLLMTNNVYVYSDNFEIILQYMVLEISWSQIKTIFVFRSYK